MQNDIAGYWNTLGLQRTGAVLVRAFDAVVIYLLLRWKCGVFLVTVDDAGELAHVLN